MEIKLDAQHIEYKLFDRVGIYYSPFKLTGKEPMMNPVSWELLNDWEDGFYLTNKFMKEDKRLIKIIDNKIVEAYRLEPLVKGKDIL